MTNEMIKYRSTIISHRIDIIICLSSWSPFFPRNNDSYVFSGDALLSFSGWGWGGGWSERGRARHNCPHCTLLYFSADIIFVMKKPRKLKNKETNVKSKQTNTRFLHRTAKCSYLYTVVIICCLCATLLLYIMFLIVYLYVIFLSVCPSARNVSICTDFLVLFCFACRVFICM